MKFREISFLVFPWYSVRQRSGREQRGISKRVQRPERGGSNCHGQQAESQWIRRLVVHNGVIFGNTSIQANTVIDLFCATDATVYLSQNNNLCSNGKC